jgi:baculoviral IAP repeat-containing protein 6
VLYFSACPSAIAVEGSRDGGAAGMVPLCTPVSTSGLTTIKIQLLRDEIVTAVMIRLHKPRDSQTIGLSQIMLMGYMAFSDMSSSPSSRIANVLTPMEDYVSRTRSDMQSKVAIIFRSIVVPFCIFRSI